MFEIKTPMFDIGGNEIGCATLSLKQDASSQEITEFFTHAMHIAGYSQAFYLTLNMEEPNA